MSIFNRVTDASFKGVKFLPTGSLSTDGGRKIIDHLYPNSDRRYLEDIGKLQRDFTITGIIKDPGYFSKKQALIKALESSGAGILKHPFYGSITVTAKPYRLEESLTTIGVATFTMTFSVGDEQIQPIESGGFIISKLVTAVLDGVESVITGAWDIVSPENFGPAATLMNDVFNSFDIISQRQEVAADKINEFNETILNARSRVNSLIRSSANLGAAFSQLYNDTLLVFTSPSNSFDAFKTLFDFSSGNTIVPTTVSRAERKTNQDLINVNMGVDSLAQAYQSAFLIDYETDEELNKILEALNTQYNAIILNVDNSILKDLEDLRDEFRRFADNELLTVDRIITVTINEPTPITDLAYRYYGSTDNYEDILNLNSEILNPAEISGNIRILTA